MTEEYKIYLGQYEVSNLGNIRRKLCNGTYKEVKGSIGNHGYRYFQTNRGGVRKNHLIHQIVAKLFIRERPEGLVIDHIDRNRQNNRVENLRYCTYKENSRNQDRYRTDIEEQDLKKRKTIITKESCCRIKESQKYSCSLCNSVFGCQYHKDQHLNGPYHKTKQKYKNEMEKNNIVWNAENYKRCRLKVNSYNQGRRKIKPLVYVDFQLN